MEIAATVLIAATILANGFEAAADLVQAKFVLNNSAEVGVPRSWLPALGVLKGAGAAGLGLDLLGVPHIGLAAALGLTLFFIGAVVAHLRARVLYNIYFPGLFLAMAVGCVFATW